METDVKTVYDGIEIEYNERENNWKFELRGRERVVESLRDAKEVIDKPNPKDKPKFEKIKAYADAYREDGLFQIVEVTSIADGYSYDKKPQCWISKKSGREKVKIESLYEISVTNNERISELVRLEKERQSLDKKETEIRKSLDKVKIEA